MGMKHLINKKVRLFNQAGLFTIIASKGDYIRVVNEAGTVQRERTDDVIAIVD